MRILACLAGVCFALASLAVPYQPSSYTVAFGNEVGIHNVAKLQAVDNVLVAVQSLLHANTNLQTTVMTSDFNGPANVSQGTPAAVTVWMWSPVASLANTPRQQIELFNFATGAYSVIDIRPTTSFANLVVVQLADIYPYITPAGLMRMRTTMTWPAGSPFVTHTDYQEIDI